MASNLIVYALTQDAYEAGVKEAQGGTLLGVSVAFWDAWPCSTHPGAYGDLGLQVDDGDEWEAAGHPKEGPALTQLLGAIGERFAEYEAGPKMRVAAKTVDQLKAEAGVAGLTIYAAGKEESK